ncbi:MAG: AI-2E family transporter [Candidatus Blackburnbacteria bacterium]|nr:AI-2E family transporter [Candidatus Blackburnbacteria bacterium]
MPKTIEISHRTIIFTVFFLLSLWVLFQIRTILIGLFVAVLLATALSPIVDRLSSFRIPRGIAILVAYVFFLGALGWGLSTIVAPLVEQTTNLVNRLPMLFDDLGRWLEGVGIQGVDSSAIASQVSQLGAIPADIVRFIVFIFSNLVTVIAVLVITFYMLVEKKNLDNYLLILLGTEREQKAKSFIDKLEVRLGGWVRGELLLMVIIGVMTYIGLRLLGIPYALPLAILAGFLEILPNIGPIISAIPGVLLALTISPIMALATGSLYFLIQQLENSLIVPKVMQKAAGVNPLVIIVSLAVGFELSGAMGAILAVPIIIVVHVVAVELLGFRMQYTEK